MLALTEDARIVCEHERGVVSLAASQRFCTVEGRPILVDSDPEGRAICGCPNINPAVGIRPCVTTLRVREGYSDFVRIEGHGVCLASLAGLTDGTPPGTVKYVVRDPAQVFVSVA